MSNINETYSALADCFAEIGELLAELGAAQTEAPAAKTVAKAPAAKAPAKTPAKKTAAKAAPVEEDDDDDFTGKGMDEAALRALARSTKVADLKAYLTDEHGMDADEVAELVGKKAVTDAWVEAVLESSDAEDEDEDEEADEEEEETEEDEEDYESMSLTELRKAAKEAGYPAARTKGLDKDALIALLTDEEEEDEEDEEDEDEEDEYDPETMSDAELKALAKENGVKLKRGMTRDQIIAELFE